MIELFNPPAVTRLLSRASTAVKLASDCGQRLERTSRVTCPEANAFKRATEIAGLFFSAIDSASFTLSLITFEDGGFWTLGADCARACLERACVESASAPSRSASLHVMPVVPPLFHFLCLHVCHGPSDRPRARGKR